MASPTSRALLFIGRFISTPEPNTLSIQIGAILVSPADGAIKKVDWNVTDVESALKSFQLNASDVDVIQSQSEGFFFPGFIDTHIHAPQYPNVGLFGKSTLLEWLQTYTFPMEASLGNPSSPHYDPSLRPQPQTPSTSDPLARAHEVYTRVIRKTLSHGTTTASYYATNHVPATKLLFTLAHQHGQRAFIGRACMDNPETCPDYYRDPSTEATIANELECISHSHSIDPKRTLISPIITPRFAPSCLSRTLTALGDLSKSHSLPIQTHISENLNEVSLVKHLFPSSSSYASVYDTHGLLTPRTVLAHAVHLSPSEMKLISQRQSKISHCPASNSALGSGICPVRELLSQGITVGLGTDVSGGYSVSLLESVRGACLVSRLVGFTKRSLTEGGEYANEEKPDNQIPPPLSVTESLHLATVSGAKVLGLESTVGKFDIGFKFDVQEISLSNSANSNVDIFPWETWQEKVEKWVWNGDDRNVRRVWVQGRLVHEL
ncbi:putative guanine deaminase [Phaeomoniella chlamydospora]|uniref:Probable guanine deaminase n=1 Tax=Phaeomoniella chlamydospora TaxID=158046 RepID=A0A0G2EQ80_PHACM|nr:putative guanine deaminase [Phaeomoniella chlamydospora]